MICIETAGINYLLREVCETVMRYGKDVEVRGMKTKELHPVFIKIDDPCDRTLLYPGRGNNPFASIYETLWVLVSKCNSIATLRKYIPRAGDYSDDGKTWRAGYPERLRCYGNRKIDQLLYVYNKLEKDPSSRQAVITLWNPELDTYDNMGWMVDSKDFPCSNYLTFLIRDNKLDLTFAMRSNDAIYGMTGINFYEFTVMQEILAGMLGVDIGSFYYMVNSLHIYEKYYEKALKLAVTRIVNYGLPRFKFFDKKNWFSNFGAMLTYEDLHNNIEEENFTINYDSEVLRDISGICEAYTRGVLYQDYDGYYKCMKRVTFSDLKVACHFWWLKREHLVDPITGLDRAIQLTMEIV